MNVQWKCPKCYFEDRSTPPGLVNVEMRDDGLYDVLCQKGHRCVSFVQNPKFEILFDLGVIALVDGYNREACANLAASLERFCEFYVCVVLHKYEIEKEEYEKTWKLVSSQSERQLGAFFFIYLMENKKQVTFLHHKYIEFRNKVIHKGYIPSRQETIDYGNAVFSFISETITELKKSVTHSQLNDAAMLLIYNNIKKWKILGPIGVGGLGFATCINILIGSPRFRSFEQAVETIESGRDNLLGITPKTTLSRMLINKMSKISNYNIFNI